MGFYTNAFNTVNIGGDVYVNNVLGGLLEIGSSVLVVLMLKKVSRRNSLVILFLGVAVVSVLTPILRKGKELTNWFDQSFQEEVDTLMNISGQHQKRLN